MKKRVFINIVVFLLVIGITNAIEFSLTYSDDDLVYPQDTNFTSYIFIDIGLLDKDDIEDVDLTLSLNGPVIFEDGSSYKDIKISKLEKDYNNISLVVLKDTALNIREYVILELKGSYIDNSLVGGGKKTVDISKQIPYISSDKAKVEIQKQAIELKYNSCIQDKLELQNTIDKLGLTVTQKENEIAELKQQSGNQIQTCSDGEWDLKYILLIIIIIILLFYISISKYKNKLNKKFPPLQ